MDRRVLGLLIVGLVTGCGGDERSSAPSAAGETTAPAVEEQPQERRDPDEQAVAEVARRYLDALASGDYDAACDTRTTKEQRELARLAGSCPKAFAAIVREKPGIKELFADARIGAVRITGREARADIVQPGQSEPAETLAAVREDGGWALTDG